MTTEGQNTSPGAGADPPTDAAPPAPAGGHRPRWLVVLAWSTGLAGLYALLGLAHAAAIEGNLTVDVGFGRMLAFWVGSVYLALLGWGFLPAQPRGWYARGRLVLTALVVGLGSAAVAAGFTALWLRSHWVPAVGVPVTVSLGVLLLAAIVVLWLAARDERQSSA